MPLPSFIIRIGLRLLSHLATLTIPLHYLIQHQPTLPTRTTTAEATAQPIREDRHSRIPAKNSPTSPIFYLLCFDISDRFYPLNHTTNVRSRILIDKESRVAY